MPLVNIEPTQDHPIPYDMADETPATLTESLAVAGNTAELQTELGAALELDERGVEQQKRLLDLVLQGKKTSALKSPGVALAAASFLRAYGQHIAIDVASIRAAVTNKLMEIANCGDPKYELKALELLGKHSDVGLFTERSEITINYKNPEDLESAIKERVKRLLNATVVDVVPVGGDLDAELGVVDAPPTFAKAMEDLLEDGDAPST